MKAPAKLHHIRTASSLPLIIASLAMLAGCAGMEKNPLSRGEYRAARALAPFASEDQVVEHISKLQQLGDIQRASRRPAASTQSGDKIEAISAADFLDGVIEESLQRVSGVTVSGIRASVVESITNNQEAAVDEGDIVKLAGRYLIVLRKGRLYSVDIGEGSGRLRKTGQIDVSPPSWKHEAWYDELLVHGDLVLVIGFSYELEASELVLFRLGEDGALSYLKTYLIESGDYYDPGNYAGRLTDGKLVLYLVKEAYYSQASGGQSVRRALDPKITRVDRNGAKLDSYPLFNRHSIFRPLQHSRYPSLYTVAVCPLDGEELSCSARSILADYVESHYVSGGALYMWSVSQGWAVDLDATPWEVLTQAAREDRIDAIDRDVALLYRFPLADASAAAVEIIGTPVDQFSFSERNGRLYVAGRFDDYGAKPYNRAADKDRAFWAEIPLSLFAPTAPAVPKRNIHLLEEIRGREVNNRFIGDYLVYSASGSRNAAGSTVLATALRAGAKPVRFEQPYAIADIQPIGNDALLIGYTEGADASETVYTSLALTEQPVLRDSFTRPHSELAESRSHGFNYRPLRDGGMFGVPLFIALDEKGYKKVGGSYYQAAPAVDMQYFGLTSRLSFYEMGVLRGDRELKWENEDNCEVSCYDWYGSSRPFFIGERIFALLKNELVEAYLSSHTIHEKQRIDIFD